MYLISAIVKNRVNEDLPWDQLSHQWHQPDIKINTIIAEIKGFDKPEDYTLYPW